MGWPLSSESNDQTEREGCVLQIVVNGPSREVEVRRSLDGSVIAQAAMEDVYDCNTRKPFWVHTNFNGYIDTSSQWFSAYITTYGSSPYALCDVWFTAEFSIV